MRGFGGTALAGVAGMGMRLGVSALVLCLGVGAAPAGALAQEATAPPPPAVRGDRRSTDDRPPPPPAISGRSKVAADRERQQDRPPPPPAVSGGSAAPVRARAPRASAHRASASRGTSTVGAVLGLAHAVVQVAAVAQQIEAGATYAGGPGLVQELPPERLAPRFPFSLRFGGELAFGGGVEAVPLAIGWAPVWPLELRLRAGAYGRERTEAEKAEGLESFGGVNGLAGLRVHLYVPAVRVRIGVVLEGAVGWCGAWGAPDVDSGAIADVGAGFTFGGVSAGRRGSHFNIGVRARRGLEPGGKGLDLVALALGFDYELGPHEL